jgi:hypothetical protein
MPRGPKGENRPADVIGNAVHVMRIATGEIADSAECWMLGKRPSRTFGRDVRPRTTLLRLWRQARPKQLLHDRGRPERAMSRGLAMKRGNFWHVSLSRLRRRRLNGRRRAAVKELTAKGRKFKLTALGSGRLPK